MRCLFFMVGAVFLSGCAIDTTSSSQLISGDNQKINALSAVNRQITPSVTSSIEDKTFSGCLARQRHQGIHTLAKYLSVDQGKTGTHSTITITSDNLSVYTSALWNYSKQNKPAMLSIIAEHKEHDKVCFGQEIVALRDVKNNLPSNNQTNLSVSDFEQSHKILNNVYDYLQATLQNTEYSELDEQFARDHIPVKVLLPTS